MDSPLPDANWRPLVLIICNALAVLLLASWYSTWGQAFWAPLDQWVFYTFNGSLAEGKVWQGFWAVVNTKRFDYATALLILSLFSFHILNGNRQQIIQRTAAGALIVMAVVLTIQIAKNFLDYGRPGPSTTLEPSILLTQLVTGFDFKDTSGNSFPGDHGIALIMFTSLLWFFAGRSYGLIMAVVSALLMLPRMVVGAHWLTDNLVGSAYISLFALSWLLATPAHGYLVRWLTVPVEKVFKLGERLGLAISQDQDQLNRNIANAPLTVGKGFCMGSADIIPGVSGGTMALILGIYERLLGAIRSFDMTWLRSLLRFDIPSALGRNDLLFLVPLGFGIVAAILFFTRIVPLPGLILSHPELIYGLFFGLIAASIVVLMRQVEHFGPKQLLTALLGVAVGYLVVTLVPVDTPSEPWFIFLCGFIAISAMLLPGISGSFILLILGQYAYIINALGSFNVAVIATFGAGALAGLVVFSRLIVWLLKHYHQTTLLLIKGILIGSLWIIWPFQERIYATVRGKQKLIDANPVLPEAINGTVLASLALMLAGFAVVLLISALADRHEAAGRASIRH